MEDRKSSENSSSEEVSSELYDLSGIDEKQAEALHESGFETRAGVASASQSELTSVEGIGKSLAARIQADAVGRQETQRESDESEDTDTNQESNPDVYVNPFPKKHTYCQQRLR